MFTPWKTVRQLLSIVTGAAFASGLALLVFLFLVRSEVFETALFSLLPRESAAIAEERHDVSREIHSYLAGSGELPKSLFTQRERDHMQDVMNLLTYAGWLALFSVGLGIACAISARFPLKSLYRNFITATIVTPFFGIACILFFDPIFYWFHAVSFSNDLWQLDPAVHALIRAYPETYFEFFFGSYLAVLTGLYCTVAFFLHRMPEQPCK